MKNDKYALSSIRKECLIDSVIREEKNARFDRNILPILPILPPSLPLLPARSHHSCGAGEAATPPLFIVLILVTSPALAIDCAATIGAVAFTDAVKVEEDDPLFIGRCIFYGVNEYGLITVVQLIVVNFDFSPKYNP